MKNFYVLYGVDKSLFNYELDQLLKKLSLDDVSRYDMMVDSMDMVVEDASTVGMFSPKKVIVLDNCFFLCANKTIDRLDLLEEYLEHYNPKHYCIFLVYADKLDTRKKIYKLFSKCADIRELKKMDNASLEKSVRQTLTEEGYQIENVAYFLEKVGTDWHNVQNELQKLMMAGTSSKKITNRDVDQIVSVVIDDEIFALTDAIVQRDNKRALILLDEFLNRNYDEMQIIMLLASQFRFFFQVKRLSNKNKLEAEIAKTLGVHPYRVKTSIQKLYSYSEGMILEYIRKLAKMDHDIKLGLMDKRLSLELFIAGNRD